MPENQSSSSNQQLLWSEGPRGEHERGATATSQRQSVVRVAVAQPSRDGDKRPEVTQLELAQAGKLDRLTGAEVSFVGTEDESRARISGLGTAATRLIVAMEIIMCEVMMRVEEWFEAPFQRRLWVE
jgi:hypothetical protein